MTHNKKPDREVYNLDTIKLNEEIARKFFEIEVSILSINKFTDFFEKLFLLIEDNFAIPYVWLSIINGSEISHLIEALESSEMLKSRINLIGRNTFSKLINGGKTPILINENLKPYYTLLPKKKKYLIKSLAVAPLVYEEEIIGSLNLGDYSGSRFEPGMDSFFLSQLALKISICLNNIATREKLTLLTSRDPLTHLLNRKEFEISLGRELSRTSRYDESFSFLLLAIDHLKDIKDTFGHNCGDLIIKHVASELKKVIRPEDTAARTRENEFAVILPHRTAEEVQRIADDFSNTLKDNSIKYGGETITVLTTTTVASADDAVLKTPSDFLKTIEKKIARAKKGKTT